MNDDIKMLLILQLCEIMAGKHDVEHHEGRRCEAERANIIAFLAHRLGADLELVAEYHLDYEVAHNAAYKTHSKN